MNPPLKTDRTRFYWIRAAQLFFCLSVLLGLTLPAHALRGPELSDIQKRILKKNFARIQAEEKGPYTPNYCVCTDGKKSPVMKADGSISNSCGQTRFCAAFRARRGRALAEQGLYLGNIFSSDLFEWDSITDHHDLVRGYILEKFFVDTHPEHQLAQLRAYGGLMGAEYEARDMPRFFERFLAAPNFNDFRDYLLAYELQKRYFVRNDQGAIQKIRSLASSIQSADPQFKPLRDATHNRLSAELIPKLTTYRDRLPDSRGEERKQITELSEEIRKLTALNYSALQPQLNAIEDKTLARRLAALLPTMGSGPVSTIDALGKLMVESRRSIAAKTVKRNDARQLIDLNVTAAAVIQSRGSRLLDAGGPKTVEQALVLLKALTNASYGVGLLSERERQAAAGDIDRLLGEGTRLRSSFLDRLKNFERVVEWAHNSALAAFAEVWAPWTYLLPDVAHIGDDIVRGSPLLLLGSVARELDDYATGQARIQHQLFGTEYDSQVRALNPGLAIGTLRVAPKEGDYLRDEVVALKETPAELNPAAGIMTQGEGNVVSHVQLLARALGIPNAVVGPAPFEQFAEHDGKKVFFIATPRGKVYLKEVAAMTDEDKAIYTEFSRNAERTDTGTLGGSRHKLRVDPKRLDIKTRLPIDLKALRRSDSGIRSGPKAAFLGELKHLFPEHVTRGIVVPFGAYYDHVLHAAVALPENLQESGIAQPGEGLLDFENRIYKQFFEEMVPGGAGERALAEWIQPRLEIIRYSIENTPLSSELKAAIRDGLDRNGLLRPDDRSRTVGCFVRSDTNVEDQDNFNGAGLNLTLFNMDSLDDVYRGLKEVWASPFTYRSFSWRQTLIDQPLWVFPSVVILESVPNDKSGVLVTADINSGDRNKMVIATSEGVGGAVDGTPAETLVWSADGIELQTAFKSPWRRLLKPDGGSEIVPATGKDHVLEPAELEALVAAATKIKNNLKPALDPSGNPRPWDIEFGFADGKLWLFQVRPFIGNEELKNIPALAALDKTAEQTGGTISLKETIR
jgi:Pyruvate phosphate dikinase, AMP/ATP-binding domain